MTTSDRAGNFFHTCFNQDTETYATRFEAYCLSGVKNRVSEEIAALKAQCTAGILAQLNDLLAPTILSKMVYSDFFTQITLKHHIIYENWPVSKFCTPGKLTLLELRRLHHVLSNGPPLFRYVSPTEWEDLDLDALQSRHDTISPTAAHPLVATATSIPSASTGSSATVDDTTGTSNDNATTNPAGGATDPSGLNATTNSTNGAPVTSAPLLPQPTNLPPPRGGDMLTLDGGMVVRPRERRRQWDAGLTKEQKAAMMAVRNAEKAKKSAGRASGSASGSNAPQE
ncbi:hypothetical protein QCA50_007905 [Cerrena zonata]|uniref:Uncharacterized protein n=1 Tax=Cerrena zonata TaxID=2478898 RepID=A0AAW0GHJ0_9APHY